MTSSDFLDEQNRPCLIQKIEPTYLPRLGEPLELNLGSYGIDLPIRDGKYLIPLQTVSDIFVAPIFLDCIYFNGKSVIIASDFCVMRTVTTHLMKKIRFSGSMRLAYMKNGSYYDIDQGAKPDYTISSPENYYKREELVTFINSIK